MCRTADVSFSKKDVSNNENSTENTLLVSVYICTQKMSADCIYHFLLDLDPSGRPSGSKSIGKW